MQHPERDPYGEETLNETGRLHAPYPSRTRMVAV
jgi:hypothetical protein